MLSIELLHLLKREFREIYNPNSAGHFKSAAGALELIEQFKKQTEDEAVENYKKVLQDKAKVSGEHEDPKNTLVK